MAKLKDLSRSSIKASTGLPGGNISGLITDALFEPFMEVMNNLKPRALFGNIAQSSGIGEFMPILSELTSIGGSARGSIRNDETEFYDQSQEFFDDFSDTSDNIEESTNILDEIKKTLDKILTALTVENVDDIEGRRENNKSQFGPFLPQDGKPNNEETAGGILDTIKGFLPAGLGGAMGGLAGGLGLRAIGPALLKGAKLFTRFLGPIGLVTSALLSLEPEQLEQAGRGIADSFAEIRDGNWVKGIAGIAGTTSTALIQGTGNMLGDLASWAGWTKEGDLIKAAVAKLDLGKGARDLVDSIGKTFNTWFDSIEKAVDSLAPVAGAPIAPSTSEASEFSQVPGMNTDADEMGPFPKVEDPGQFLIDGAKKLFNWLRNDDEAKSISDMSELSGNDDMSSAMATGSPSDRAPIVEDPGDLIIDLLKTIFSGANNDTVLDSLSDAGQISAPAPAVIINDNDETEISSWRNKINPMLSTDSIDETEISSWRNKINPMLSTDSIDETPNYEINKLGNTNEEEYDVIDRLKNNGAVIIPTERQIQIAPNRSIEDKQVTYQDNRQYNNTNVQEKGSGASPASTAANTRPKRSVIDDFVFETVVTP
jgi:hypothetical protein